MDKDRIAFVQAARSYLGVPFRHQGRNRVSGLDCAGLIIVSLQDIGKEPYDCTAYRSIPDPNVILQAAYKNAKPCTVEALQHGDVIVFRIGKLPQHLAIYTDKNTLIHSLRDKGVVEQKFNASWESRLIGVYSVV